MEPTAIVGSERYSSELSPSARRSSPRWTLKQEARSLPLAAEEQRAVRSFYIDWRRIMSLMRLYSLTASDLEDWASSGEEPGTHLPNELTQAGTDSKLICILTKAQSRLRMVSSGTACPQLLRQMIPAGHSSKQPPTRDRCCFFQEVHNELTKVWHAATLLILPPSPLLMALKKKGYGKLSIWRRMSWMPWIGIYVIKELLAATDLSLRATKPTTHALDGALASLVVHGFEGDQGCLSRLQSPGYAASP